MTGLETVDDGEIYFGDRMVHSLPAHERKAGLVFQDLGLWPGLTVIDNVGYPLEGSESRATGTAAQGRRSPDGAADRQPGRPAARSVVGTSAAANGAWRGRW